MQDPPWKLRLFGKLTVERNDRHLTNFRREKTGLLLALLACEPHHRCRRDDAIERLWPDQPPESGRNRLRVAIAFLRKNLETGPPDRSLLLVADRQEIRLNPEGYVADTSEFENRLVSAAKAGADPGRIADLEAAVELYGEGFLPQYDDPWILAERARLADAYLLALRRLTTAYAQIRMWDPALATARRAVETDPFREESHCLLMQVHALMNRPQAAVRQYRDLEEMLRTTMGTTPARSTQRVLAKITEAAGGGSVAHADIPAPAAPRSRVVVTRPDRPALRLRVPLTRLVGREDAILQVREMLETPGTRLVTLTGLGGIGKTRLALAVADRMREGGRQVCFLELAALTSSEEIAAGLASALQVPVRPRADLWERLADELDSDPPLLVLDNMEHLLPEAAGLLHHLLELAPSVTCLTTSRQRLGLPGEYEYSVGPLALPAPDASFTAVAASPGVRLWLDRARAADPDFRLTADNSADVAALCRRLDGLPLAIELAAAWADVLAPAQVSGQMGPRSGLMVSRLSTTEARHASLDAALDWSFDRLTPAVQRFLATLSLFPGGWTLEAAASVCREPEAVPFLAQLRERSLVTVKSAESGRRYCMIETVRQYAATHLSEEYLAEAAPAFRGYFVRLAEEVEPTLKGPDAVASIQRLKDEEENFGVALRLALEAESGSTDALRLSLALYRYWYPRGLLREARHWITAALDRAAATAAQRTRALLALGNLAYGEGDWPAAETFYTECRALAVLEDDPHAAASALGGLGNVAQRLGALPRARSLVLETLDAFQKLGDARGEAQALGNLLILVRDEGDLASALAYGVQAAARFRDIGDQQNLMMALANSSGVALKLGNETLAVACLRESLEICIQLGATRTLPTILLWISGLARVRGRRLEAARLHGAARQLWDRLRFPMSDKQRLDVNAEIHPLNSALGESVARQEVDNGRLLTEQEAIALAKSILSLFD